MKVLNISEVNPKFEVVYEEKLSLAQSHTTVQDLKGNVKLSNNKGNANTNPLFSFGKRR